MAFKHYTKEEALENIKGLVSKFHKNTGGKSNPDLSNEAQVEGNYIQLLLRHLNWDVHNDGLDSGEEEVILQYQMKGIGGKKERPDYLLRVKDKITKKMNDVLIIEAKQSKYDLQTNTKYIQQAYRYARSTLARNQKPEKRVRLALLTDFEEFRLFDCLDPAPLKKYQDKRTSDHNKLALFNKHIAKNVDWKYTDYVDKFDLLWELFSKDKVADGSLNDLKVTDDELINKRKAVDYDILADLEQWRKDIAKSMYNFDKNLSMEVLTAASQLIINRILFIKILSDRDIAEDYLSQLLEKIENNKSDDINLFDNVRDIFKNLHNTFNGNIFEKKELFDEIKVSNRIIKRILSLLKPENATYTFADMSPEIIGTIYEDFLGKVIVKNKGIIDTAFKSDVQKAKGVYYTPRYIVDYIVKNTLGKKIKECKSLEAVSKIKILDPACGSGSFLIGAYDYLLHWHLDFFKENIEKNISENRMPIKPAYKKFVEIINIDKDRNKINIRLRAELKKEILVNNIFGVDIDAQAVEVAKFSLYIKALEDCDQNDIKKDVTLFDDVKHEKILPELNNNIKCGNSLIGWDYQDQFPDTDDDTLKKINPFDWNENFTEIFENGKFNIVIGNPPYGFHQVHENYLKPYLKNQYKSSAGSFENYFLFFEKSLKLLTQDGIHGFIIPVTWLTIPSAASLRKFILDNFAIKEICWLPEFVFKKAKVNTLISITKSTPCHKNNINIKIYNDLGFINPPIENKIVKQNNFIIDEYIINIFDKESDTNIINKIGKKSKPLLNFARPCSGYNPYEVGKGIKPGGGTHTNKTVKEKPYHSNKKIDENWKKEIIGRNLSRFFYKYNNRWIKYGNWLAAPRKQDNFNGKRILVQEITGGKEKRIIATYIEKEIYYSRDIIPIKIEDELLHPYYLLGIINSYLISWYHHKRNPKAKKGLFPKVLVSDLKKIPIKPINDNNENEKYQKIINLVSQMIENQKLYHNAKLDTDKNFYQTKIQRIDDQIDELVYELYELTPEEIKIVKNSF